MRSLAGCLTAEHSLPIPRSDRKSEEAVKSDVVNQDACLLVLCLPQSAPNLLEIFGQRERGTCHLNEFDVWTVEAFAEYVDIHQHPYPPGLEILHQPATFRSRRPAVDGGRAQTSIIIIGGNVSGVADADGIDNAFPSAGKLRHAPVQPPDCHVAVQHAVHLRHLIVTIGPALLQTVNQPLLHASLPY